MSTRRQVIGGAAAVAVGAKAKKKATRRADVVVVGAGFAGLAAAQAVVAAGRSVIVLEARKRVGGRIHNQRIDGGDVVEIGGQWVGPTQDRLIALAEELGVETYKTYNDGDNVFYKDGALTRYASSGPLGPIPPDALGAPEAFLAIQQLNAMAAEVPRDAPWTAARADEYDGQTFETWKRANAQTAGGRVLLDLGIEAVWAAEPRDVSLLHVLFYINSAGNETTPGTFDRLINTAGGAQESRFVGGSQLVAQRTGEAARQARRPRRAGARARADRRPRARRQRQADRHRAPRDRRRPARGDAARSASTRVLPGPRAQLLQRFPMGSVVKCMAVYPEPFWREEGLTGQATSDTGPVKITFDNTPPDGVARRPARLHRGRRRRACGPRSRPPSAAPR